MRIKYLYIYSQSKLCNYFNIVPIPTTRWIHMYYYKLYLLLIVHKVINLIIRLIYFWYCKIYELYFFKYIFKLRHFYGIESFHINNND